MTKFLPLIVMLVGAVVLWRISAWTSGRSLRRNSTPLRNDQIEGLLGRLASAAGVDHVRVRMLDAPIINGLATPSGEIYVTRGLVSALQSGKVTGPEFASVIAHEMGHLALGHTKRRMVDVAGAQAAGWLLGGVLARIIPFVGFYIARWVASFLVASLSRQDEFEADRFATALMVKAGLGAEPQARMLEKLKELVPQAGMSEASWLASHPPVGERAAAIRHNASRWGDETISRA